MRCVWQGVGYNSILCTSCNCWVHKKCSGISGSPSAVRDFTCKRCSGILPIQNDIQNVVTLNGDSLEVVQKFCYLGNMLDAGGGAQSGSMARVQCVWGKFRNLLPLLSSKVKEDLNKALVETVMQYGSETWPVKVEDTQRLHRNETSIHWICHSSPLDRDSCDLRRERLGATPISELMRVRRLRLFSHTERKEENCCLREVQNLEAPGKPLPGRPPKSWSEVINDDLKAKGLAPELALNRDAWLQAISW